jgi:hypothetical protein
MTSEIFVDDGQGEEEGVVEDVVQGDEKLTQAQIEERSLARARACYEKVRALEASSIVTQATMRKDFQTPGLHGVVAHETPHRHR